MLAPPQVLSATPFGIPSIATNVGLTLLTGSVSPRLIGTSLVVNWGFPSDTGGNRINKFLVEWSTQAFVPGAGVSYVPAVQSIAFSTSDPAAALTGFFRVVLPASTCIACAVPVDATSAYIPITASDAEIEHALENMPNTGDLTVTRTVVAAPRNVFTLQITFNTDTGPIPALTVSKTRLVPLASGVLSGTASAAVNAVVTTGVVPALLCYSSLTNAATKCPIVAVDVGASEPFSYTIPNLVPGVTYYVRVAPGNDNGFGPTRVSTPASLMPPKQAPDAPVSPYLTGSGLPVIFPASGTSIHVLWKEPSFDGGDAVAQYIIEYDPSPNFNSDPVTGHAQGKVTVSSTVLATVLTNLTPETRYFVRLATYNAAGRYGAWTSTFPASIALATSPAQPTFPVLTALPGVGDKLALTWGAPASNGSPVSSYRIDVLNRAPAATDGSHFGLKKIQTLTATAAVGTFTLAYGELPAAPYALPGNVSLTHIQVFATSGAGPVTGTFALSYSTVCTRQCCL